LWVIFLLCTYCVWEMHSSRRRCSYFWMCALLHTARVSPLASRRLAFTIASERVCRSAYPSGAEAVPLSPWTAECAIKQHIAACSLIRALLRWEKVSPRQWWPPSQQNLGGPAAFRCWLKICAHYSSWRRLSMSAVTGIPTISIFQLYPCRRWVKWKLSNQNVLEKWICFTESWNFNSLIDNCAQFK